MQPHLSTNRLCPPTAVDAANASHGLLPRGPVLDWSSFKKVAHPYHPSMDDLPHTAMTSSGRAAIYHALLQLKLPAGSTVLVPTYHSPTMIAPVVLAHLDVAYYGIGVDGLPLLNTMDRHAARKAQAMLVTHYFGITRSLAKVRQWCDARGVVLIEDCAHAYFGAAGERPVGAWGDYSTASLPKFFPMSEGGLLASAQHPISKLQLKPSSLMAHLKGVVDILEPAIQHQRLKGLNRALSMLFWLKNSNTPREAESGNEKETTLQRMMLDCDMERIHQTPLWTSRLLKTILPRGRIIAHRHRNYAIYAKYFDCVRGAIPLFPQRCDAITPYVFPLWVDDADRIYQALREQKLPVYRWDRVWPGTPHLTGDVAPSWNQHVLQLLCHQDLSEADITRTALALLKLLPAPSLQRMSAVQR